jgi:PadR family transcriptional regulator, regulatory protein PadR
MYLALQGSRPDSLLEKAFENWTVQVRKGVLELCVLNAIEGGEQYGYDLVKSLTDLPGLSVTEGTLYPLLSRLRLQGLLRTRTEASDGAVPRKYYALTQEGRRVVRMMNQHLEQLFRSCQLVREGARHE